MAVHIYKYPLKMASFQKVSMPEGAKILHFDCQFDIPTIWAEVFTLSKMEDREFFLLGTGHELPTYPRLKYIGTALFDESHFVWHLYELGK